MLFIAHYSRFACDAGARGDRTKGIWDVDVADIEGAFGTKLGMNKAERLDCGDSSPTHAMMISGVHVEKGKPVRYRIENSWGPEYGDKGECRFSAYW
jgi:bleomycin hydrolase